MSEAAKAKPRVPTVHKMAQLVDVFTADRPVWPLHQLASELSWDKSTTHRFATELVAIGLLDRDSDGSFLLGRLCLELAAVYQSTKPERERLVRQVDEIATMTGLTTQLGILEADVVNVIACIEGTSALKAAATLGQRLPLHATGMGKAVLWQLGQQEIESLLPQHLPELTEHTITSRAQLVVHLQEIGDTGFARADSEYAEGLYVLAIPLPRETFGVPSSLCCAGPSPSVGGGDRWDRAEKALRRVDAELTNRPRLSIARGHADTGEQESH